ncbi:uncharacterized protein LOC135113733 isoform X3 [Scylla paramamosain]|uniref:uncharacterized protein LOC135113733 isoform X3 n=1 Tax=Scylla paramamosain TaxID=85552 RepID=UPI0030832471
MIITNTDLSHFLLASLQAITANMAPSASAVRISIDTISSSSAGVTMQDCEAWARVEDVLEKLGAVEGDGALLAVRDDTLLLKLHSHLHTFLLHAKEGGQDWGQRVTLLHFVQTVLDPLVVANTSNSASVALALRVLASLVTVEADFSNLEDSKALSLFMVSLPSVRSEPSLASPALSLAMALMAHPDGLLWLVKNGIWEKMLLPCLRSPSIFVQREGVNAMVTFMLNLRDTQHFEGLVKDLYLLSDKFCELRSHMDNGPEAEEIRQTNLRVLSVFKQLFWQTLGKSGIYTKMRDVDDINIRILAILQNKVSDSSVSSCTDLLILNLLHKFYEKLMNYGILEQFLLDSLCADVITLSRLLLERGYIESFVRSSANVHKYWDVMMKRMKEEHKIDLTSVEALLHIITAFEVTCLVALYQSCLGKMMEAWPEKLKIMAKWRDEVQNRISTKEEIKAEAGKLERQMVASFCKDTQKTVQTAVTCITAITAVADHLNPACAVTIFQGLTFMLCSQVCPSSPIRHHVGLQRTVIDGVRKLVERFNIDWRKCYASVCLMGKLCDMAQIPGLSSQVKVSALKAMNSCINGFIPPVMSMLVNSGNLEHNSVEQMGQVLAVYLADVKWEVRDSALEVLITCMKLAKEKYPHFVNWLGRHHLNTAVITAIGDVEGYVRASAFTVLANIISIDKAWSELELEEENLPHRALSAVLNEGEAAARKAALTLVQELFLAGKFSEEEVDSLVVQAVQHCAEDPDNEVRLAALEFIRTHLLWSLGKNGMVDGEFPSITFSRGKIIKLDTEEVKSRVVKVLNWVCECGYLCVLLASRRDLVASVASRAREVFCFLSDLVTRYQITQEDDDDGGGKRSRVGAGTAKDSGQQNSSPSRPGTKEPLKEETVLGHLDQIDKTIQEILNSSTLENVSTIKRFPQPDTTSPVPPKKLVLTPKDMPQACPSLPLTSLLQAFTALCQPHCCGDDEKNQVTEMISLLEDILLDGERQQRHLDDQGLRDCY